MPPKEIKPKRQKTSTCYICGRTESNVFRFPKKERTLAQWCTFCKVSPSEVSDSFRLCIRHFEAKDFINRCVDRPCLKNDAIPCIYAVAEVDNLTTGTTIDVTRLKMSMQNNLKSLLSKDKNLVPNTCPADRVNIPPPGAEPRVRSTNDSESDVADTLSSKVEVISIDLSGNETFHAVEDVPVVTCHISDVQIDPNSSPVDSTTVSPIRNAEGESVPLENFLEIQLTPTGDKTNCPGRKPARALRFIGDIKSPDLESPRRRKECLAIIRYENKITRRTLQNLKRQNKRLKAKNETLEGLIRELRKNNLPLAARSS